jgi:hypothetical protein
MGGMGGLGGLFGGGGDPSSFGGLISGLLGPIASIAGGGGMGGMGGGMRSVPATGLPFTTLNPKQTKALPTRLVSLSPPDPQEGLLLPDQGEKLRILSPDQSNLSPLARKALKRLSTLKAPTSLSQLVMWRVAAGLDWDTISQLSGTWANNYELTLAQDFVARLETLPEGETGRVLLQFTGSDTASESTAAEVGKAIQGITLLGLQAQVGEIPSSPEGPSVVCKVRFTAKDAMVQIASSDATAKTWVPFGKFSLPVAAVKGKFDTVKFVDGLAEGVLNRLVRTQLSRGPREKGKETFKVRIDNASPLILNGLAVLGTENKDDVIPKVLSGIAISPQRSMTVPASEEFVKKFGLKKGMKVVALDLSAL